MVGGGERMEQTCRIDENKELPLIFELFERETLGVNTARAWKIGVHNLVQQKRLEGKKKKMKR